MAANTVLSSPDAAGKCALSVEVAQLRSMVCTTAGVDCTTLSVARPIV